MKRLASTILVLGIVAGVISGCEATAQPKTSTPSSATQTPWIVVVTATPGGGIQPTQTARIVVVTATHGALESSRGGPTQTPWIIVATPTSSKKAAKTPTERPEDTPAAGGTTTGAAEETSVPPTKRVPAPAPTSTAKPGAYVYPPPALREPTEGAHIEWGWTVVFDWEAVGDLGGNEFYRVSIERPAMQDAWSAYGDWHLTKEPTFVWSGAAKEPFHPPPGTGSAPGSWWVTVVRQTGVDENGRAVVEEIGAPSERRALNMQAKP